MTGALVAGATVVGAGVSAGTGAASSAAATKAQKQMAETQMKMLQYMYGMTYDDAKRAMKQYGSQIAPYLQKGLHGAAGEKKLTDAYAGKLKGWTDQAQYEPYMEAIRSGMSPYTMEDYQQSPLYTPMPKNLAELQATPGYQFELQQGQQALAQTAAARGGLLSGAQQRAAGNYAQKQASTGFQSAWERAQRAYQAAFEQRQSQAAMGAQGLQAKAGLNKQAADLYAGGAGLYGNMANRGAGMAQSYGQAGVNTALGLGQIGTGYSGKMAQTGQNYSDAQAANAYGQANAINQGVQGALGAGLYAYNRGLFGNTPSIYGANGPISAADSSRAARAAGV